MNIKWKKILIKKNYYLSEQFLIIKIDEQKFYKIKFYKNFGKTYFLFKKKKTKKNEREKRTTEKNRTF